jgi:hypothetical protein
MRAILRSAALAMAVCAAWTAPALAGVIYVKANATGANNGSSWTDAFTSLQSGLAAAGSGDEIWVASATYKPTATTDRTIAFALKNNVGVYGGFVGNETMRSQRDPVAHVTTLSGDIGTAGSPADNSYHVVTSDSTVTSSGKLDGFTVSGGQADGNPASSQDRGAGIWINGGSALISGVTFTANFASFRGAGARVESGSPRFLSCTFVSNSVPFTGGGGGVSTGGGTVSLESCVVRSNSISGASTGGGGIQTAGGTTLLNTVVAQNSPNGLQITGNGNTIQDSTFTGNQGYGAAFLLSTGNSINNSVFWGDLVPEIFFDASSSASITYCDVQGGSPFAGAGNINADPLFLAPPSDLRPGAMSPVVDSGNNNLVPGGTTLDIRGLPRFFDDPDVPDTGVGNVPPGIVDMGAYERIAISVSDPASQSICSGDTASFSVTAEGQPTLTYQWRKNGNNLSNGGTISGATTAMLTINPAATGDSGNYDVVVTDGFGQSITSSTAVLTVNARPTATAGGDATICSGDSTDLSGSGGISCSWLPTTGLSDPNSCNPNAAPSSTTVYSLTVMASNGCASTNTANVTVTVNVTPATPVITAPLSVPVGASGASASVVNHPGSSWTWTLSGGTITAGQGSRQIVFDAAAPGTTMACTVVESASGCLSPQAATNIQVDFLDIPPANAFHAYVVSVARNGITAGCGGGNYCGTSPITRAQMAVFLLKAEHGATYVPPACTGMFTDVACPSTFANWIEQLANEGVTGGCGGGNYCPTNGVTRAQMAVFLLKTSQGSSYTPPGATGTVFSDVPASAFAADWIEDLYSRNITGGCGTNPLRYCPSNVNNRQQMAVFITKTFGLP